MQGTRNRLLFASKLIMIGLFSLMGQVNGTKNQNQTPANRGPILSSARLNPPLRSGNRRARFSPDGAYILLQDDSGIHLLSHEPFERVFSIPVTRVLPAVFSSDSKTVVIAARTMEYVSYNVSGAVQQRKALLSTVGRCVGAGLAPTGTMLACIGEDLKLRVFTIPSGSAPPSEPILLDLELKGADKIGPYGMLPLLRPLDEDSAFSEPFGFIQQSLKSVFERNTSAWGFLFSLDGRYLLVRAPWSETTAVDLETRKRLPLSSSVSRRLDHVCELAGPNRLVLMDPDRASESAILSFPDGEKLEALGVAGRCSGTSNSKFLLHATSENGPAEVIDLETHEKAGEARNIASDIYRDEIVSYTADGQAVLSKLGSSFQAVKADVSLSLLPTLRTAVVSPDLQYLAISVGSEGALFRTSTGDQIARLNDLQGAWFGGNSYCYARLLNPTAFTSRVTRLAIPSGEQGDAWNPPDPSAGKGVFAKLGPQYLVPSGGVLFAFLKASVVQSSSMGPIERIRALDMATGTELWSRDFEEWIGPSLFMSEETSQRSSVVPFSDPQGDRLVLAWPAKSVGARSAAKKEHMGETQLKHAKLSPNDSYFEVLDARLGKHIGGTLVQSDAPPEEFDSAFSEGDWLVMAKDGQRVIAVSLATGEQTLKLFGRQPCINGQRSLLAAIVKPNRMTTYDLKTGAQIHNYDTPSPIAYMHFSEDGQRLLMLTSDQTVYVLDVSATAPPSN